MNTTHLIQVSPRLYLMNTITLGSRFRSLPWTQLADMSRPVNQLRAAFNLRDAWQRNYPLYRYEVRLNGEIITKMPTPSILENL